MIKLKDLLLEGGCSNCSRPKAPLLTESTNPELLNEHVLYHVVNKLPITENTFRYGSFAFLKLWDNVRQLYNTNQLVLEGVDKEIIDETDLGQFGLYEGKMVPLDLLMEDETMGAAEVNSITDDPITEKAKSKKKNPPLNKPKRGGSKKFYVYVRKPGGGIKKVSFGQAGMSAKINNPKARAAFAARHDCKNKKDKTKASYWSCRLPRYAKLLGLKSNFSGFW